MIMISMLMFSILFAPVMVIYQNGNYYP